MATTTTQTVKKRANSNGSIHADNPAKPQFPDVKTIKDAIPPHCFVPSTWRSLWYVARDFSMAGALMWAALAYIPQMESQLFRATAWGVYGFLQGLIGTGIWILAHECGHGAFSLNPLLNDFVGWVAHSAVLMPYFSWKFSHHRHHRFTGHMDKDMVFVPPTKEQRESSPLHPGLFDDVPIVQMGRLFLHQLGGFQLYLFFNVTAGEQSTQRDTHFTRRSHFDLFSAVFRPNEAKFVLLSDLGLAIVFGILYVAAQSLSWSTVFLLYVMPYIWVHHWLVAITYLHHTHPEVPHYENDEWTFVKGALATIDRDFGFIGRHIFHGIIETHVVHHIFPRIPFYYQDEATDAIRPLLGDLYHRDTSSFLGALWSTFNSCKWVEKDPKGSGALKWARPARQA